MILISEADIDLLGFSSIGGELVASPEKALLDVRYFTYRGPTFSFDLDTDVNLSGLDFDIIDRYRKIIRRTVCVVLQPYLAPSMIEKEQQLLARVLDLFAQKFNGKAVLRGGMVMRVLGSPGNSPTTCHPEK